ncbi:MAG: uridine kinase [Proteobacteria bacterium]|nr:MAG: uridine kinase [Pseudomonadota bacterium]
MSNAQGFECRSVFVSIVGASCSGKTALAKNIAKRFSDRHVSVIAEDAYYKRQDHLSLEERAVINYDHPSAFDHDLLIEHMNLLRQGRSIESPTYDYVNHTRADATVTIDPTPVIIVEGILLYHELSLRDLFALKLFVDTPLDICLARRVERDVIERGRTVDSVLSQYQKTVRPMYNEFIEPSKYYADLIVPMGGYNEVALSVLDSKITHMINNGSVVT